MMKSVYRLGLAALFAFSLLALPACDSTNFEGVTEYNSVVGQFDAAAKKAQTENDEQTRDEGIEELKGMADKLEALLKKDLAETTEKKVKTQLGSIYLTLYNASTHLSLEKTLPYLKRASELTPDKLTDADKRALKLVK